MTGSSLSRLIEEAETNSSSRCPGDQIFLAGMKHGVDHHTPVGGPVLGAPLPMLVVACFQQSMWILDMSTKDAGTERISIDPVAWPTGESSPLNPKAQAARSPLVFHAVAHGSLIMQKGKRGPWFDPSWPHDIHAPACLAWMNTPCEGKSASKMIALSELAAPCMEARVLGLRTLKANAVSTSRTRLP